MAYEMMVGLTVTNDDLYTEYRENMRPLLIQHGGGFRYDFKVSEVLKTESDHPINRVFAIYFKDEENMNAFFNHPDYKKIKGRFFEGSVGGTTIISQYNR
ncbi:MAG: DUF1330 domain-containing protein [Bacteriovoracia bacterium]